MKTFFALLALVPNLLALDITTLDGKTYKDCQVSKVYPDSICVLFGGSGARIKFSNLPETTRVQYGYDVQRAAAFEQAEAARLEREQAMLNAQRAQSAAQRRSTNASAQPQVPGYGNTGNTGAQQVRVALAGYGGYGGGYGGGVASQYGNQFGNGGFGFSGAQYVGVRLAGPGGGIRGVTSPYPTQARPPGNMFP